MVPFTSLTAFLALVAPHAAPPSNSFAIVGAHLEIGDGTGIDNATVLVQDGKIVAFGAGLTVPDGVEKLAGAGWTVYPAFIDAYCTDGVTIATPPATTIPTDSAAARATMNPAYRKGITPEIKVAEKLTIDDSFVKRWREQGFGVANFAPRVGSLRGLSAVARIDKVDKPVTFGMGGECAAASGGGGFGGGYPSSSMGVVALMRQVLYDAQRYRALADMGEKQAADPALDALGPVVTGKQKMFFVANSENDVVRALNFKKEFDLDLVVVSAKDAAKRASSLAEQKILVLLSVDWAPEPTVGTGDNILPTRVFEDRKRLWAERNQVGIALAKAGVNLAIVTQGESPEEMRKNVAKLIGMGFPRDAATKAFTSVPAEVLGISDSFGMIRVGKAANLTILSGDLSKEDAKTVMVVLDGVRKEVKP